MLTANQGDADAQYKLGLMYYRGNGVKQDSATAREYFEKACKQQLIEACDNLKAITK